jgi:WhiB family redox-sensing transcriptional regulator
MSLDWQQWMNRAACRPGSGIDPELFHPVGKEEPSPEALAACQRCPVSNECLTHSFRGYGESIEAGVWGGMSEEERQNLKRRRNRRAERVA